MGFWEIFKNRIWKSANRGVRNLTRHRQLMFRRAQPALRNLVAAIRYVERNPVRSRMVRKAWQWKWSSAAVHCCKADGVIRLKNIDDLLDFKASGWEQYLDSREDEAEIDQIRTHTMKGRPLGATSFIEKVGKMAGRVLTVMPRGRPKKKMPRK